jgi:hypothetical protein
VSNTGRASLKSLALKPNVEVCMTFYDRVLIHDKTCLYTGYTLKYYQNVAIQEKNTMKNQTQRKKLLSPIKSGEGER